MKNTKGFSLFTVIIIICVVSIVSGITTGIIMSNSYHGISTDDKALNEFLKVYSDINNNYYEDVDKEGMIKKAVDAMLNYLGDSYTTYLNKDESEALESKLSSTYRGIGVSFLNRRIEGVFENSPAMEAGLQVGDMITKVGDIDVTTYPDSMITEIIKNNEKDYVSLTVTRNEEEITVKLNLKNIETDIIAYTMIENTNIGYLNIPLFAKNLNQQVNKALTKMEESGMQKLIIDLRNDSGGYLDEAEKVASIFLPKNKLIYSLEGKSVKENTYDETDSKKDYEIIVLINGKSASAAEILAAALKDSYGATLLGTKSFGKGKVQQTYSLSDGSMAKLTSAKWYRPNGECIDGIGITPDIIVENEIVKTEDGTEMLVDSQIEKAITILKGANN